MHALARLSAGNGLPQSVKKAVKRAWGQRGELRTLTRAGGLHYTIKLKSDCREPELSLPESDGLGPNSPAKNKIRLLASLGSIGKIGTLLLGRFRV